MHDFSLSTIPLFSAAHPSFGWGVMPTSIGKTGKAWSVQFVDFWYVHAGSKQTEPAYSAIEVLNTEDFEVAMAQNLVGGIPTLKSVAERFTKELFKVDPEVPLASLDRSREPYYAVNHNDFQAVVNKHIGGVWSGQESVQQATASIVREAEPILAADKEG
jgi:ABC-type glycerol-3-phosphate transport system substrate-binding protein